MNLLKMKLMTLPVLSPFQHLSHYNHHLLILLQMSLNRQLKNLLLLLLQQPKKNLLLSQHPLLLLSLLHLQLSSLFLPQTTAPTTVAMSQVLAHLISKRKFLHRQSLHLYLSLQLKNVRLLLHLPLLLTLTLLLLQKYLVLQPHSSPTILLLALMIALPHVYHQYIHVSPLPTMHFLLHKPNAATFMAYPNTTEQQLSLIITTTTITFVTFLAVTITTLVVLLLLLLIFTITLNVVLPPFFVPVLITLPTITKLPAPM
mmetsp:Transcript_1837/g.2451  ORF Transcript_1837/g.2451 Transcript_1837/m.2451 type:complete len:258 (-) Transcript_1837:276-1049(-)